MPRPLLPISLLLALVALCACDRTRALGARPDIAATWDVMQDDVMQVRVVTGGQGPEARLDAQGGTVAFHDAGVAALSIDCSRPELVCPTELLASELTLDNRTGDMSDDGEQFALSFAREGKGDCRLLPGSSATADVQTHGSGANGTWIATALTGGVTTVVLDGRCFEGAHLPEGAQVVLSSGFSAARR